MDRLEPPKGYVLDGPRSVEQILAVQSELLLSEGIEPSWPGFDKDTKTDDRRE